MMFFFILKEIARSWWVFAFAILTFALYEQAAGKVHRSIYKLENQASAFETKISDLESEQEELELEVASQNDPSWIEFSLIKGLGLVPEGYTKVYFEEEPGD